MKLIGYVTKGIRMYVKGNTIKYVCKKHTKEYCTDIQTLYSIFDNSYMDAKNIKWRDKKSNLILYIQYKK